MQIKIFSAFLFIVHTRSYILLTANLEDFHNLGKQLESSDIVDQLSRIWKRASKQFQNKALEKPSRVNDMIYTGEGQHEAEPIDEEIYGKSSFLSDSRDFRKSMNDNLVDLSRNASSLLNNMKKLIDKVADLQE